MAKPCIVCDGKKTAGIHSRHHPQFHKYLDDTTPGVKPMSEGMRNFRQESGYDAAVRVAKGRPCQIVSPVCTGQAEHLHEALTRAKAGGLKAAVANGPVFDSCDACNSYIQENQVWAMEHGFLFRATVEGKQAAAEAKRAQARPSSPTPPRRSRLLPDRDQR